MKNYYVFYMIIHFILNISFLNGFLIIVCLEKNITETDSYLIIEYQLRHLTDTLEIFDEEQKCIDYISTISLKFHSSTVYFILSDNYYDSTFPVIQQQEDINPSVYIFSPSVWPLRFINEKTNEKYYRLFTDHTRLISSLSIDIDTEEKISMSINMQDMKNVSIKSLDKESQMFLLFQILTFTFHDRQHDSTEINNFVNILNQYNERGITSLDQSYLFEDIIQWYRSDTFISQLLNEALRTKNISLLYKLRFFIISLIEKLSDKSSNILMDNNDKILTSYRKECITNEKLIKLKVNINQLLSINEFYLTTIEKPDDSFHQSESANVTCVLFQIDIDTNIEMAHPDFIINNYKTEILFTFGTVFQIHSVELDTNTQIWNVKLIRNKKVENQILDLIHRLADEFAYPFDFMAIGQLMYDISEHNKAIESYRIFLNETPEDDEYIPMAYEDLGLSYYDNKSYIEAIESYHNALRVYRLRLISPHDYEFVKLYTRIGQAHFARHQYAIAIDYYNEAIRIMDTYFPLKSTTNLYLLMSHAYLEIGDDQKHHEYLGETALIQTDDSSFIKASHDPSFKRTINYTQSLEKFQKVLISLLNTQSSTIHEFDYDIATLYYKIGDIYFKIKNYEQSLDQFKKVLDIYFNIFPLTFSNLATNYHTITDDSIHILQMYLIEHELHFRFLPLRYSLLAETYYAIARIYFLEPQHMEIALNIYKLATAIEMIQQDY